MDPVSVTIPKIYDVEGNELDRARHPREIIRMKVDVRLHQNDLMRIKRER